MDRFTISLDESLACQFDQLIAERRAIEANRQRTAPTGQCVANLSYGALNVIALEAEHSPSHGEHGARHRLYRPLR